MGLRLFGSSFGVPEHKCTCTKETVTDPNPNPKNFRVLGTRKNFYKTYTAVLVKYPNCTNFEGKKILVLKGNWHIDDFTYLDPHFMKEDNKLIARFRPDLWHSRVLGEFLETL